MKTRYLFIMACAGLLLCLFTCKKDDNSINLSAITGKWNVVSDSTYVGVGVANHAVNYSGHPGDYFTFTTNGNIYTKEGAVLDTLNYNFVTDTGMVISAFGIVANGTPSVSRVKFTANSLVITSAKVITPGGVFWRKASLTR